MKKFVGTVTAAVLAAGTLLVAPSATAVPASVVTTAEFNAVAPGNSIEYVRKTFGNHGKVLERYDGPGTASDYVAVQFPTYYPGGRVEAEFLRRTNGTWYLVSKYAYWANAAVRTANKATEPEFNRVRAGNSIEYARNMFGTNGTITEYYDAPGTEFDGVVLEWPTADVDGWVQVYFTKNKSGTWVVDTRSAYWDVVPAQTADKVTEPEFNRVGGGSTLDYVRSTFGTTGTIDYYSDAPGTADDAVGIVWPVASADGWVAVGFAKSPSNVWKVSDRTAYWARVAEPTIDVVTPEQLDLVGIGSRLDDVREAFGTRGTIAYYSDAPGTGEDVVDVAWYTGASSDDVYITFWKVGDVWTVVNQDEILSPWVSITPLAEGRARSQGSSPVEVQPKAAREPEAPARPTWDLRGAL